MIPINTLFSGTGPLLIFLAKATVLLIAAIVATISLRRSTAGARHLVWLAGLVGVLALPVLSRIQPLHIGVLPSALAGTPDIARLAELPTLSPTPEAAIAPVAESVVSVAPAIAPMPRPIAIAPIDESPISFPTSNESLLTIVAIAWAAVALALVGWLVAGALSVRRIVFGARELTSPDWTTPLCEVADRLDLELPPRLVISDRIEMAFACRALAPTIVLPASAESWSDDRRRAVLFHELAHVKRHDLVSHTLGRVACALYWFHPLVWTAAKNLRAESERACDDLVLSCGARPSEYAQHLLDMVTSVRHHGAPIMALPMARKKEFEGRMLAILDPAIRRASPGRLQAAGVVAMLVLLSVTVAAVAPATASTAAPVAVVTAPPSEMPHVEVAPAPITFAPSERPSSSVASPHATISTSMSSTTSTAVSNSTSTHEHMSSTPNLDNFLELIARETVKATSVGIQQAGKQIVQQLHSRQSGDTSRTALLIQILGSDADASVRRTAAWGMNEVGGSGVSPALIKALKQDTDASVREMAAWSLAEHESDASAAALADALLHDKSARVRETSAWALGDTEARHEIGALESALSDSDAQVRHVAIWAIGQMGGHTAPKLLTNSLTDASKNVRLVTAWALGEIEDKSTGPAIIAAFQTETDNTVRSAELRALAAMGQTSPAMIELALKSTDPELRRHAVAMLAGSDAGVWPWPWPWPQPRPMP